MITRTIQKEIESCFFKGKAVILLGARQVGKTTLVREIARSCKGPSLYLNCDETDIVQQLTATTTTQLAALIGRNKLIIIDEAQRVKNIGLTLKLLVDAFPERQILATGSSSLDLADEIVEPLTGRKYEFHLYPLSLSELGQELSPLEINRLLERLIVYGTYPEIVIKTDESERLLSMLASSYLYRDLFRYQDIRRPELLEKLLVALALQIGQQVSYTELANTLGVTKETISTYVQLLEKAFVIFRLGPFSRNLRSELTRTRKIYFHDTGIRNALIRNFTPSHMRNDWGVLWENFMISERWKFLSNSGRQVNRYFWRTHSQQEIDLIEESGGQLDGYEIKWREGKIRGAKAFLAGYPESRISLITQENYREFVGIQAG